MNIIYCRVSTASQTLEPQLRELRTYATARGITIDEEITDIISGSKSSRAGLDRLMTMVRAGQVKMIMTVKLDRLARSLAHFASLIAELNKLKVALVVPGQNIDTSESNPASRFLISILGSVAELERDLIRERTIAGLQVARAEGKQLGRVSPIMPRSLDERQAIVMQWRQKPRRTYKELGKLLGGVGPSTAWQVDRKTPKTTVFEVE
jgi:DNA invertase Pin-like site-specific DNA recombinase